MAKLLKFIAVAHVFCPVSQTVIIADFDNCGCRQERRGGRVGQEVLPRLPMAGYVRVMVVGAQDVPCLLHHVFLFKPLGYGEVTHWLLHVVSEGTFPVEVGVGKGVMQTAAASGEYFPIAPVPFFPDRPS